MPQTERKKVPVYPAQELAISRLRQPGSPEAAALSALTGVKVEELSEAKLLNAVLDAGLRAIEDRADEDGQRRLAEFRRTDPDHLRWRASRRARAARRMTGEQPPT